MYVCVCRTEMKPPSIPQPRLKCKIKCSRGCTTFLQDAPYLPILPPLHPRPPLPPERVPRTNPQRNLRTSPASNRPLAAAPMMII